MNLARTSEIKRRRAHERLLPAEFRSAATTTALGFLLATFSHAQNSQFLFDPNGNLTVQLAGTVFPPQIIGQPQDRIVALGDSASFSVVALDTRLLTYQWRFNGTNIGGATNDAVLRQNVSTNHEGEYRVVLTNPSGSVTSAPALLMIDSDADGMGDSWETTYFGNLNQLAAGDADGDGSSNLQEFLDGGDPTDGNSVGFHLLVIRDGGSVTKSPDQITYTNGQSVTLTAIASPGGEPFHAWMGDILTRSNPVTLVMTNNKTVIARFTPIVFTWTNPISGDWNGAANWTPNLTPGSNDSVVIPSGTVTLNTPAHCAAVTLGSAGFATLTGTGALTVWGNFAWMGGAMIGSGRTIVETNATLEISTAIVSLDTRIVENAGTIRWSGGGSIGVGGGAIITNRPGALFEVQNSLSIGTTFASGRLDNAGTFRKSSSAGVTTFISGMSFNNSGAVDIQTGALNLGGGGAATGTFTAQPAALVEWSGGTFTLNPGAQLNDSGLYRINGGTVAANASFAVENLVLVAGTLDGTGTVTISNAMSWPGGALNGSGRTIIAPGATLDLANPLAGAFGMATRTLENAGTILMTGAGTLQMFSDAVLTNRAGALVEVRTAGGFGINPSSGRFDNAGTFRKALNSGTSTVGNGVSFNNYGVTEIQSGSLNLDSGGTHSGSFAVPAGSGLIFSGGTHGANATSSITGAGQLTVSGGTVHLAGLVNVSGSNTFSGGTANLTGNYICTNNTVTVPGPGTVNFSGTGTVAPAVLIFGGSFNPTLTGSSTVTVLGNCVWLTGAMAGSGRTIIAPGATLDLANPFAGVFALSERTLENAGTILFTGAGLMQLASGAVITNRAGALIEVRSTGGFGISPSSGQIDNAGVFRKTMATGTFTVGSGVSFNNQGTVDIRSGILAANSGFNSSASALLNCALGGTTPGMGYGQLQVAGTVTLNGALSVDFTNEFSPALNDAFTVLTAGTRTGTFVDFHYPSNAVTMQLSSTANAVVVSVTGVATPAPLLLQPELLGAEIKLTWTAVSNATYRLEFNPDLNPSAWTALPGDVIGVSNTASKLDPLTPSNRLYRVRVLP